MRHTYGQDIPTDRETNIQTKASSRQTDRRTDVLIWRMMIKN